MPFKDLLVHLDGTSQSRHRLDFAVALAAAHDAHLTGLYILDLVPALAAIAQAYPGRIEELKGYAELRAAALDEASATEAMFNDLARRDGIDGEWRYLES